MPAALPAAAIVRSLFSGSAVAAFGVKVARYQLRELQPRQVARNRAGGSDFFVAGAPTFASSCAPRRTGRAGNRTLPRLARLLRRV